MNTTKHSSIAELADKSMQRVAVLTILLAFAYTASAISRIVPEEHVGYLAQTQKWLFVVAMVFAVVSLLPLAIKKLSLSQQHQSMQVESFINNIARTAFSFAWAITIISIPVLNLFIKDYINGIPQESLLEFIQALLAGGYGVSFLILNRSDTDAAESEDMAGG